MKIGNLINKLLLASILAFSAGLLSASPETSGIEDIGVRNLRQVDDNVYSGGQPSKEQLTELSEAGIKHIVTLRTEGEISWDERAHAESLGITFHHLPINGAADINSDNAQALSAILSENAGEPTLVHCGSGNRVGALAALMESQNNGADLESAVAEGRRWGLTRLEPTVRKRLSEDSGSEE